MDDYPSPYKAATVPAVLADQAKHAPEKPFLLFPERDESVTYAQMAARVAKTAHLLRQLGVQHGDKVALLLPNIPEFLYFYWGAMALGAVAGPVNTLLKGPEIAYIADNCEAMIFVTTAEYWPEAASALDDCPKIKHRILVADGDLPAPANAPASLLSYETAVADQPETLPEATLSPDDVAMIIYTSGTTGKPKGVLLTHHNLIMDGVYIQTWFGLTRETRMMCILPLFHVNGEVVTMMTPLVTGASVVLNRKFSAGNFWNTIARYEVNVFSTVPTILSILLAQSANHRPVPTLKFGICGAAPLPVEVHRQFEAQFGTPIYEGYGLSETTCYSTFNPPDVSRRKIGSIGVAVGNEVAIWDEAGQPMPDGEGGEIVVRGENVMKGYFGLPDATAKAFAGGWFHTGDWGMRDADGFFFILDRVKDMIIRGGENIYPREIDEVLYTHPDIEAAATIGIPDPKYGETVKSYVVLKPGAQLGVVEIIAFCKARLADFKCPTDVAFIDEIPKGPTGKLLRRALRDMDAASSAHDAGN